MLPLAIFILVIAAALLSGALVAYPVFLLARIFTDPSFPDIIILTTQLSGLFFALGYLKYADNLNLDRLGYRVTTDTGPVSLVAIFVTGLSIIFLLAVTLIISGLYAIHEGRDMTPMNIMGLIFSAVFTGLAVSIFEETLFRGALLQGLLIKTNGTTAVVVTSIVYACVHFMQYPVPAPGETINAFSAVAVFFTAWQPLFDPENFDAFMSLLILGALLGLLRLKTKSILACIALHAGLVAGIKLFRFFLEYRPEGKYDFLVSGYDHRLGGAAIFWMITAAIFYYLLMIRKKSV